MDNGRFLSEFGFQSLPNWKTVLSFTEPEDRHILSPVMFSHGKNVDGIERLIRYLTGMVGFPKGFREYVCLTQFVQAEAVKMGIEYWRLRKFNTSGTLYWQFNDCWPVTSWSCIDYYKRKKAFYYYTRKFFSNTTPVLKYDGETVGLHIINDTLTELKGHIKFSVYKLDGTKISSKSFEVSCPENSSSRVRVFTPEELGIGYKPFISYKLVDRTNHPAEFNGELLDSVVFVEADFNGLKECNYLVFDRFRDLCLKSPHIKMEKNGKFISLTSDIPAFGVFVETENDVDINDNCLNMEPGKVYKLECSSDPGNIEVFNLADMVTKIY